MLTSCTAPTTVNTKPERDLYSYRMKLAKSYLVAGDFKSARIEALKLIDLNPTSEAYNILGLSYMGLGEIKKAEESFKRAVELSPDFSPAWTNLSACYIREGRFKEAITAAEKALSNPLYANPEKAYVNMADAYAATGHVGKAIELLNRALKYNVSYAPAYERLLRIYIEKGDITSAKGILFDAKAAGANSPGVSFYNALILIREGKVDEAREILKGIVRDYPLSSWAKEASKYLESIQ